MQRAFSSYHPIVSFLYFTIIIVASMMFMHPMFVGISLITSIIYSFILDKNKAKQLTLFGLVMAVTICIANGLFVHRGVKVLFFFRGNPITLESILYGALSGCMMMSVIMWFSCYNEIITSDKFLYIFGKILPSIALIISMTLRLIPKLISQGKIIAQSQKTVGLDYSEGNIMLKIKSYMRVLSILVTWALEDAVQTADSMKARGYGVDKRSNFSIFIFIKRDLEMLIFIITVTIFLFIGYSKGLASLMFYPSIAPISFDITSIIIYISFALISLLPIFLEIKEEKQWKQLELSN